MYLKIGDFNFQKLSEGTLSLNFIVVCSNGYMFLPFTSWIGIEVEDNARSREE